VDNINKSRFFGRTISICDLSLGLEHLDSVSGDITLSYKISHTATLLVPS
jgi:hypothetical protein